MRITRLAVMAIAAAGLAGCGGSNEPAAEASSDTSVAAAEPAAGQPPATFAQCVSCHAVKPGLNGVGPTLFGVVGRKAASEAGYAYSAPLKAAGLTWDEATLDKWLSGPMQMVPGTKMVFPGLPDPAKRKEVIEYLKTLK